MAQNRRVVRRCKEEREMLAEHNRKIGTLTAIKRFAKFREKHQRVGECECSVKCEDGGSEALPAEFTREEVAKCTA